jgi:HEPN domain-containing protein
MNEIALEWISRAENDIKLAHMAFNAEPPISEGASFHAQQCAEKYLKAYLQEEGIQVPRTHHLMVLLDLCLSLGAVFEGLRDPLTELESYAVAVRYPGVSISKELGSSALKMAELVRDVVRRALSID